METPFLPPWRARLAPLGRRVQRLRQQSLLQLDRLLHPLLPPGLLAQTDEGPNSRERVYSVRRTFFGFLSQVLNPDCPCREIVRQILALRALLSDDAPSPGTSAYCQARQRLPWDILPRLRCALAARADRTRPLWRGLCVKVIDGTGVSLPDTKKNQRAYPQPGGQKPGCGFPLIKGVVPELCPFFYIHLIFAMQAFQQSLLDVRASHTLPAPPTPLHRQNQMGQSSGLTRMALS